MSEVLQANIFFMITGIAVIIFTALLCVLLFHVIKLVNSIRRITQQIEQGVETVSEDVQTIRAHLASGAAFQKIIGFLFKKRFMSDTDKETNVPKQPRRKKKRTSLKIKDES